MLRKGALVVLDYKEDQFLSLIFIVKKKDREGNPPVIILKDLRNNIPYQYFKMERLFLLKEKCCYQWTKCAI